MFKTCFEISSSADMYNSWSDWDTIKIIDKPDETANNCQNSRLCRLCRYQYQKPSADTDINTNINVGPIN